MYRLVAAKIVDNSKVTLRMRTGHVYGMHVTKLVIAWPTGVGWGIM